MSETPDARQQARPGDHRHRPEPVPDCNDILELAAPYALAAVETEDRERIDLHLGRCPTCAVIVDGFRETANLLGLAVPITAPRASVKFALLDRIDRVGQAPSPFQPAVAAALPIDRTLTIPSSQGGLLPIPNGWNDSNQELKLPSETKQSRVRRFRPNWQLIATPLATVPLVFALGIVGLWAMNTQHRLSDRSNEVQLLSAQVSSLNHQVDTLNNSLASVGNFVPADNAKSYSMTSASTQSTTKASGTITANPGTDQAMLSVKGLSGNHRLYEVLLELNNGGMVPAGELPVGVDGTGKTVLSLTQPITSYKSIHVKPKPDDTGQGVSDSQDRNVPDALFSTIDPNLGRDNDTDAVNVGQ